MNEKLNEYGQIINPEDAHDLAKLEEYARRAKESADQIGADVASLEEPTDGALGFEDAATRQAAKARELADTALEAYVEEGAETNDK